MYVCMYVCQLRNSLEMDSVSFRHSGWGGGERGWGGVRL